MDITWGLIGAVAGSAAFGAIIGKFLDAFLLSKINGNIERQKWLRQEKLEQFSKLSKELSSLGFESNSFDNQHKLHSIASSSILLIDDESLVNRIQNFIVNVVDFTTNKYPAIRNKTNATEIKLPSGDIAGEKELAIGFHIKELQTEAFSIISELNINLKNT